MVTFGSIQIKDFPESLLCRESFPWEMRITDDELEAAMDSTAWDSPSYFSDLAQRPAILAENIEPELISTEASDYTEWNKPGATMFDFDDEEFTSNFYSAATVPPPVDTLVNPTLASHLVSPVSATVLPRKIVKATCIRRITPTPCIRGPSNLPDRHQAVRLPVFDQMTSRAPSPVVQPAQQDATTQTDYSWSSIWGPHAFTTDGAFSSTWIPASADMPLYRTS